MDHPAVFSIFHQIVMVGFIIICLALLLVRFLLGPSAHDRLMTVESITVNVLCLMAIAGLALGTPYFIDAILVLSIVGYISTVAIAKYLEKGDLFDE